MAVKLLQQGSAPGRFNEVSVGFDMLSDAAMPVVSVIAAGALQMGVWNICSGGSFTVTMPTAVGNAGKIVGVRRSTSGSVAIAAISGQMFDGMSGMNQTLFQGESALLISDGVGWYKIAGRTIPRTFAGKITTTTLPANAAAVVEIPGSAILRSNPYQITATVDGKATVGSPGMQYLSLRVNTTVVAMVGCQVVGNFFSGLIARTATLSSGTSLYLVPENYGTTTVSLNYLNGLELHYVEVPQW